MGLGLLDDGVERALEPVEQERPRLLDRERERGVQDVRRGQAEVEPAPLLAERLGDRVDERRDVVVRLALELRDPRRRRRLRVGPDAIDRVRGDHADRSPPRERRQLDVQHPREPRLVRPDPSHGGPGVARRSLRHSRRGTCRHRSWLGDEPGTELARDRGTSVAILGDRIDSGWWDGVPRRKCARSAVRYPSPAAASAMSSRRRAPGNPDQVGRGVGPRARFGERRPGGRDAEQPPAVRHQPAVRERRAGVEDERARRLRLVDALDRSAAVAVGRVLARGERPR